MAITYGKCFMCNRQLQFQSYELVCTACYDKEWEQVVLDNERDEADKFYAELKARLDERAPA